MSAKKTVLTILAVTLGYVALKAYQLFSTINIKFSSITLNGNFSNPELYATFTIENPTNYSVKISSIAGSVYADGKFLCDIKTIQPFEVYQSSFTITDLKIDPTLLSVANFIGQFLTKKNIQYSFDGHIYILGIPFRVQQNLLA